MLLYAPHITPRLRYMAAWLGEQLQVEVQVTDDVQWYRNQPTEKINYSPTGIDEAELHLQPAGLLFEQGIEPKHLQLTERHGKTVLFPTHDAMGFDFLAAAFYCLSRYEEYGAYEPDAYGRYAHTNSVLFAGACLHRPVVDEWMQAFRNLLRQRFPLLQLPEPAFRFIPTYDVDIAWSYRHKAWWRLLGGVLKQPATLPQRIRVWRGKDKDPYDCYHWLTALHQQHALQPLYFFPMAARRSELDKNIAPRHPALRRLIQSLQQAGADIGLHPSVYSNTAPEALLQEKATLEHIVGTTVDKSRHHFLRMHVPHSYRQLLQAGITHDYTMGYGTINGFRAGTSRSFLWYDLEQETTTRLRIHPFAFMDANAYYEAKQTPRQMLDELRALLQAIKQAGGTCITIFHNHLLGNDPGQRPWREAYRAFLEMAAQ